MKIAFLIPMTSKGRNWKILEESYILNYTFKTFLQTKNDHDYCFYIGIDKDDLFFNKNINNLIKIFENHNIQINITVFENIKKGHLTKMWNILFQKAFADNNDYFYQCGDDIKFETSNWINDCIECLVKNNNIGIAGPNNRLDSRLLLTQCMVHKKHMEIFGYFFPETIQNWYCDDWITQIYYPKHFFKLDKHRAPNLGGKERYSIVTCKKFYLQELDQGITHLNNYLKNNK